MIFVFNSLFSKILILEMLYKIMGCGLAKSSQIHLKFYESVRDDNCCMMFCISLSWKYFTQIDDNITTKNKVSILDVTEIVAFHQKYQNL